jgi:hypothetical protein
MATVTKIDYAKPILRKQSTDLGEPVALRNATDDEIAASKASEASGQDGYIDVDGVTCYVED